LVVVHEPHRRLESSQHVPELRAQDDGLQPRHPVDGLGAVFRSGEAGEVELQGQDVSLPGRLHDLRELVVRLPRLLQCDFGEAARGRRSLQGERGRRYRQEHLL
jgi:hypothetical protein